jgi:hypothetical protein
MGIPRDAIFVFIGAWLLDLGCPTSPRPFMAQAFRVSFLFCSRCDSSLRRRNKNNYYKLSRRSLHLPLAIH